MAKGGSAERSVDDDGVGLADALKALRADLEMAREKTAGTDLQLPIQSLTVELNDRFDGAGWT